MLKICNINEHQLLIKKIRFNQLIIHKNFKFTNQ